MSEYLVFNIRGEPYALPVEAVDEVQRMAWVTPVPESPSDVCGVVDLRGQLVVVIEPSVRLGHEPAPPSADDFLVIAADRAIAIKVQRVTGVVNGIADESPDRSEAPDFVAGYLHQDSGPVTLLRLDSFLLAETRDQLAAMRLSGADELGG